jgi:hypothetical protein
MILRVLGTVAFLIEQRDVLLMSASKAIYALKMNMKGANK